MPPRGEARERLLDAALAAVRANGLAATSVEALCAAAGVSKGALFHHFPGKEALALAAMDRWAETTGALFAAAPYHAPATATGRALAYLDFRLALIEGRTDEFTCFAGTVAQEAHLAQPALAAAAGRAIFGHAGTLEADLAAALAERDVEGVDPAGLARFTQAALQGAFILAKAGGGAAAAREAVLHLRRYLELLLRFEPEGSNG